VGCERHGRPLLDTLALWHAAAIDVSGRALDCGHYIAEERSAELLAEMLAFFGDDRT
jgi:haloacetate dehalogenase